MTISAKLIDYSVHPLGPKLATVECRYPKFIHGEAKTHRLLEIDDVLVDMMGEIGLLDDGNLSRNSSSSRAIPVSRLIQDVIRDPVTPSFWGRDQKGMQAAEELTGDDLLFVQQQWNEARRNAITTAKRMALTGAHKQIVNRVLEPFAHINTVVSATEWSNFFEQRIHEAAQPEMRQLAEAIKRAIDGGTPRLLQPGEWHLPYVEEAEVREFGGRRDPTGVLRKLSTARCARVSYLTHERQRPTIEADVILYQKLVGSRPIHASPAEHQGTPDGYTGRSSNGKVIYWAQPEMHGNFGGFIQNRKQIEWALI